jgi:hypothetical protein
MTNGSVREQTGLSEDKRVYGRINAFIREQTALCEDKPVDDRKNWSPPRMIMKALLPPGNDYDII